MKRIVPPRNALDKGSADVRGRGCVHVVQQTRCGRRRSSSGGGGGGGARRRRVDVSEVESRDVMDIWPCHQPSTVVAKRHAVEAAFRVVPPGAVGVLSFLRQDEEGSAEGDGEIRRARKDVQRRRRRGAAERVGDVRRDGGAESPGLAPGEVQKGSGAVQGVLILSPECPLRTRGGRCDACVCYG